MTNFTIDKEIVKEFTEIAKKKAINKSALIENYIKQWIQENK